MYKDSLIPSIVRIESGNKIGTGFVVASEGKKYVITCFHNITDSRKVLGKVVDVKTNDNHFNIEVALNVVFSVSDFDLCLLKFADQGLNEVKALVPLSLCDASESSGSKINIFGFPNGNDEHGAPKNSIPVDSVNSASGAGWNQMLLDGSIDRFKRV